MNPKKTALAVLALAIVAAFFLLELDRFLTLDALHSRQEAIEALLARRPLVVVAAFFLIYVAVTALSLPGAVIMTLAGGAIFGVGWGTVIVSFASSVGAVLAFLVARFLLRDWVQARFGGRLATINRGVAREGVFYLFTLRLVPAFPFVVINLVMALTPLRATTFYWVSQLGMLPATVVYVNAGTQLAAVDSVAEILSPGLIASFVLLGVFPFLAKWAVAIVKRRRLYKPWPRPARFDRDLVVIGAGSGGLVTAYISAIVKAKVSLIEKHRMGGDCLNTGCVPSKALLRSGKLLAQMRRAGQWGLACDAPRADFAAVMERVQQVIGKVQPHDSVERYTALGVDVISGEARILSPWAVAVNGRTLSTRTIVIATGAEPFVPPIPGLDQVPVLTSDTVWALRERPERLVVLGGGPIGCELAQAFARLGCRVTQVEMLPRLLMREDPDIAAMVLARFRAEGMDVRLGHKAARVELRDGEKTLVCTHEGDEVAFAFDAILVAVGRRPNTCGFGLEELGIGVTRSGTIEVDDYLRTRFPNIYAVGDVTGPYQFTHVAAHQAWFAAVNGLFGSLRRFKVDYSVIPWATFTEPEVARVGLNESDAAERGVPFEVTTFPLAELDRAIADGEDHGVVKVLTVPGKDRILGVTIVGEHAGDLIAEFVLAMRHGLGLNKILSTIHIYPTLAEANKYAAGAWKRAHKPEAVLGWLARYHTWRRGGPAPDMPEPVSDAH